MDTFLRSLRQRQEHLGYFVICFLLFGLAVALARAAGWWAVFALWAVLIGMLELVYRWTIALGSRNRHKWWARSREKGFWFVWKYTVCLSAVILALIIRDPFLRYAIPALLAAGLVFAAIIRRGKS